MAESLDWPDSAVFTELKAGFDLVGDFPRTGVFVNDLKPRTLSVPQLMAYGYVQVPEARFLGKVESHALDENSQNLWGKTCAEATEGLLKGPLTEEEVNAKSPQGWVPVRRFAVLQSSQGKMKLRPIDDFSENKVNLAFGCSDKLDLFALDEIVGVCRVWTAAFLGTGELCWPLSTEKVLTGAGAISSSA